MRSSWVSWVVPKSSDKCLYKRHTGRRRRYGKMETETEVKEYLELPEIGRSKEGSSSKVYSGSVTLPTL